MLKNEYPIFKMGNILTREDLNLLRDNPMELLDLMYKNYCDGIISGFDLKIDLMDSKISVAPGILKYNGKIFWMNKEAFIEIPYEEDSYIIKIKLKIEVFQNRRYIREGIIICENSDELGEDELEIARFINRIGADLQNNYDDFKSHEREHNMLRLIEVKYSSKNIEGTLHPLILLSWGREVAKKVNLAVEDVIFYMRCLENSPIEREIIITYINGKMKKNQNNYTNYELYSELLQILKSFENRRELKKESYVMPEKIIVD